MYWTIRNKAEREKAKAAFEANRRPVVQRGPRPDESKFTPDALTIRGTKYAFADHGGPLLAQMLAHACCRPLGPGYEIEVTSGYIRVDSVKFFRGVAATFTRLTYEALQRARKTESLTEDNGPPAAS